MATIVHALNWDSGYDQSFLAINPLADEVTLYQTNHDEPGSAPNELQKIYSFTGVENIQCMAYSSARVGWAGVGTMDGNAHIFDITKNNQATLRLRSKHSRPCNALSFNNGSLVAASFDKSRQDNSLQVWDLAKHTTVFDASTSDDTYVSRPQFGYSANEATLSAVFNAQDPSGMTLMAGSYKLLREFDLRENSSSPVYQVATRCTMRLTLDPFQPHMFSSMSDDGSVAIWDRRKLVGAGKPAVAESPALFFPKLMADQMRRGGASCFRYSPIRRGEFAAVFNGDLIRRWNTGIVPKSGEVAAATFSASSVGAGLKQQSTQLYNPDEDSLFVACVVDSKTDLPRVVSFDYAPDSACHTSTNFVCMREKGSVFRMPVVESIETLDFNSYNEFTMAGPGGTETKFAAETVLEPEPVASRAVQRQDFDLRLSEDVTSTLGDEESTGPLHPARPSAQPAYAAAAKKHDEDDEAYIPLQRILDLEDVMKGDMCSIIRQRALLGYGVETERNFDILVQTEGEGASLSLRNTWKWLTLAKKSLDKGTMVKEGVDLGFVGVLAMWRGVDELRGQQRSTSAQAVSSAMFSNTVRAIVAKKGVKSSGISIFSSSEQKMQRKLSLIVSGWYLTAQEFDEKINALVKGGHVAKAAGWAVFHDDVARAIQILASCKEERLQLMSTAVAGYLAHKDTNVNSPWNDLCRKLSSELDDPYLRAIFAFIADNDWWDVLDEHALPLRERLGIAVRFLSDKDLNVYLNRIGDAVVARGELEGLILTGLTPRGIDLLQSYVDRTSDVQTAALIAQFAVPRYFSDPRVDHWIDAYRALLNSWGLFKQRARFDVARTKAAKSSTGTSALRPTPRQVFLQCRVCKKNTSSPAKSGKSPAAPHLLKHFNRLNLAPGFSPGQCAHCGAPLPRCAICLLHLGSTVPDRTHDFGVHENFSNKFSFCLSCNHGYHAHHAEEWFGKHYVCPVPDCSCRCNSK